MKKIIGTFNLPKVSTAAVPVFFVFAHLPLDYSKITHFFFSILHPYSRIFVLFFLIGFTAEGFNWQNYLKLSKAIAAPRSLFNNLPKEVGEL